MANSNASIDRVIEIDGQELSPEIELALESTVVVDRLAMPDTFTLVFRDPDRKIVGDANIQIGSKVKISTTSTSDTTPRLLHDGEVTSIETEYGSHGTLAVVRGYDRAHRLSAGRKSKTYTNVKISDIAKQIASAAGLTPDVDETDGTLDHVFQHNQSDLDFLYELAHRTRSDFRVDGEKLLFKRLVESSTGPGQGEAGSEGENELVWGSGLLDFRARVSGVSQVSKVEVRGWDPKEKKEIIGTAEPTATHVELPLKPTDLAGRFNGQTHVVVDRSVATQQEAEQVAGAHAERIGSSAFEATAVAAGSPTLRSGTAVSIANVDSNFAGKWVIQGSRHEFGSGLYRTTLEFAGRQDRSLHGLLSGDDGGRDRLYGVYPGIVSDNDDPDKQGRVKVKLPWLDATAVSDWARIAVPGSGKDYGFVWMPEINDEVLVAFEAGNASRPYIVGGLWNGVDTIPFEKGKDLDAGKVITRSIISRTKHKITFRESSQEASIELATSGGAVTITLDEQNKVFKVAVTGGKVQIQADTDVEIKAGGSMKLEATGQMTIKGATVAIN